MLIHTLSHTQKNKHTIKKQDVFESSFNQSKDIWIIVMTLILVYCASFHSPTASHYLNYPKVRKIHIDMKSLKWG